MSGTIRAEPKQGVWIGDPPLPVRETAPLKLPLTPLEIEDFTGVITGKGYKGSMDDPRKVPLTLIPPVFPELIAKVLKFGAKKYARGQWMKGMSYSEVLDAAKRHIQAIENGEDIDPESGEPHIGHVGCCMAFLSWFQYGPRAAEYQQFDDRLFKATK